MQLTVVHLIIGLGGGGAEHLVLELSKKSALANIKTIIISLTEINTIDYKFKENHLEVHYLKISKMSKVLQGIMKIKAILNNHSQVLFHAHMFHGLMAGVLYSLIYQKIPIVFTLHNTIVPEWYRRIILYLCKPLRQTDINFSPSIKKWYLKNTVVIPNGVDFENFTSFPKKFEKSTDTFQFLFLGRIEEQKNPFFLIELANYLTQNNQVNFRINLAGDGSLRKQLEQNISIHQIDKFINILGFQNNINELFNMSHCLILPSLWEGLPISLIEASAAKLPIITTPVGSIPEFFNNSNCEIAELKDFGDAMIRVINNYDQALNKSIKLYNDNKDIFDIKSVFKVHLEAYNKVLKIY